MIKILVLGGGKVGSAIAFDLSKNYSVTVADIDELTLKNLKKRTNIKTILVDISSTVTLKNTLQPYNLIISAVPGFMGYKTLQTIIECKKNVVDISFSPEDPLTLNELAIKNNVSVLVDLGVAPGLGNVIFGHYNELMKIDSYECYVGGLPKKKTLPFQYKAPFSPIDVVEEYTRPARLFENHKIITKDPLTELEIIQFDTNEDLEAFNTDGLRTLLKTMSHVPYMKEKTLRYPGHAKNIQLLKDIGLFSTETTTLHDLNFKPIDIIADILKKDWKLEEGEEEFTVMRIIMKNSKKYVQIDLYDEFDKKTQISSMARTTGYTCTAGANLIINKLFNKKGVYPPELLSTSENCYNYIIKYLKERNINFHIKQS
ncbi:MAG: saccharopine dehydrogenase [Flavobacteriales bacterium TMED191]|nr:MAG: saccharopine dehydrogenase [Flavobacteriales bacterium TMED191]